MKSINKNVSDTITFENKMKILEVAIDAVIANIRAGAENLNKAISENLLPFKVREDIRMDQKNEKKSKKKSLTSI